MGTPSEVFAGRVLDEVLGFNEVVFVDKAYDYKARSENHKCVIEVKLNILSPHQMKALAKKYSKGDKAFLLIVDKDENYCLFELVSTNLASPPIRPLDKIIDEYHTILTKEERKQADKQLIESLKKMGEMEG